MKFLTNLLLPLTGLLFATTVAASSGGGFDESTTPKRQIDQQYELGKSYFKARQLDGSKLKYCLKVDGELKKLGRRSVKVFRNSSTENFVKALYNCENSQQKIMDVVPAEHGPALLYYLNKRFKLRLQDS